LFHRTSKHDQLHRCPTCEKPFIYYAVLKRHIQRCHNWKIKQIHCPEEKCDKSFQKILELSNHLYQTHKHPKKQRDKIISKLKAQNNSYLVTKPVIRTFWSSRLKIKKILQKLWQG
jgi:uncharacterized C2H2 Zn-finger protein